MQRPDSTIQGTSGSSIPSVKAPSLPGKTQPPEFQTSVNNNGVLRIRWGRHTYDIEAAFSYPYGGENRLSETTSNPEPTWKVSVTKESVGWKVERRRKILLARADDHSPGDPSAHQDTLTSLAANDVGIILYNDVNIRGKGVKVNCLSPTSLGRYAGDKEHGIGIAALDDVYRMQIAKPGNDRLTLGTEHFGLPANGSYTFEWAVYPCGTGDFFELVNSVRESTGINGRSVDGGVILGHAGHWNPGNIPSKETVEGSGTKYVCWAAMSRIADDPEIAIQGFDFMDWPKDLAAKKSHTAAMHSTYPGRKFLFHVAHTLRTTNRSDGKYADARLIDKNGNHAAYSKSTYIFSQERLGQGWAVYPYYPTMDNSYGKDMLKSVDVMMDAIGADGVFIDGLISGYGGGDTYDGYTYDRWDGYSFDIDVQGSKVARRRIGNVYLLGRDVLREYVRRVNAKGGVVIANRGAYFRQAWRTAESIGKRRPAMAMSCASRCFSFQFRWR